jgi:hypothetical protein
MAPLSRLLALTSRFRKPEFSSHPSCCALIFSTRSSHNYSGTSRSQSSWPSGCVLLVRQIMCPQSPQLEVLPPCPRQPTGSEYPIRSFGFAFYSLGFHTWPFAVHLLLRKSKGRCFLKAPCRSDSGRLPNMHAYGTLPPRSSWYQLDKPFSIDTFS